MKKDAPTQPHLSPPKPKAPAPAGEKASRLSDALRANLKRRKAPSSSDRNESR